MCLIVFAWQSHPDYPLIVASNRDEFYTRSTRPASWWGQAVSVLAGRDEEAGGTWLGINRGGLVVAALQAREPVETWMKQIGPRARTFNGFNLLVGDALSVGRAKAREANLHYLSNRRVDPPQRLQPGIYGLSNAFLDTPWPKVTRAVARFSVQIAQRVDTVSLMRLLADREIARDHDLPQTGVPLEWERVLSSIQIRANGYGTRTSTVLTVRRDGLATFVERCFDPVNPDEHTDRHFEFMIDAAVRVPPN
jgi:uncharacterized protein with NRDE domain